MEKHEENDLYVMPSAIKVLVKRDVTKKKKPHPVLPKTAH